MVRLCVVQERVALVISGKLGRRFPHTSRCQAAYKWSGHVVDYPLRDGFVKSPRAFVTASP
jgi:hypothetical protein